MSRVIVIGGGAAGMMAAIAAADTGAQVTIYEKNEKLGKKLFITGKGRCNVTNAGDMENLFANVMTNEKFLYSAFYTYDNQMVMDFLEKAGCPLKVERGDRVFPVSDHSSDVIAAFSRELKKRNVKIELNTGVKELLIEHGSKPEEQDKVSGVFLENGKKITADKVIVATGGISYASTGSTGDGYKFAEKTGHKLVECKPSLVPFNVKESWCQEAMGVSLKNVSLRLVCGKKEIYSGFGEMLITHFGISGPLVLSASCHMAKMERGKYEAMVDFKPALDEKTLDTRILSDFSKQLNRDFRNALGALLPSKIIPFMVRKSGIDPEAKVNAITKEQRQGLVRLLKGLTLEIKGFRPIREAIITQGGISVSEINPSTMESRLVKGLFFAGEIIDVDAYTGGYNLQIAFSTGA